MSNLKYKLEALLFSSARSMSIEELSSLARASPEEIREKLNELKRDYAQRDSSITLIDEGSSFRLNIKSEHVNVVQQIVTETELSRTLMETLAVIAFKYPIKQSDLIKIRTNKAYDHLRELEDMGYITRQKFGRTNLIKLAPKFFDYFDLPPDKLKEKFQGFEGIAKAIKEKEEEIKKIKEGMKKKAQEAGKKEHKADAEIDLIGPKGHKQPLEVYEEAESEQEQQQSKEVAPIKEKVGNLEVVDLPEEEQKEESEETQDETDTKSNESSEQEEEPEQNESSEGSDQRESAEQPESSLEAASKEESEVDEELEKMLHPQQEIGETEVNKEKEAKEKEGVTEEKEESNEPEQDTSETGQEPTEEAQEPPQEKPESSSEEEPKDLLEAAAEEEQQAEKQLKKRK